MAAHRELAKWSRKLETALETLQVGAAAGCERFCMRLTSEQDICTAFEEYKPRQQHEVEAHNLVLNAMQRDLDDRRAMVEDLRQQRNAKVLATYQNVWRLAPRLNAPDICTAKTMLRPTAE